jgi:hypothetical protein
MAPLYTSLPLADRIAIHRRAIERFLDAVASP